LIDFADVRSDANAQLLNLVNYWVKKPIIAFHLIITRKGDSIANAIHSVPMVNYVTASQKKVQIEWGKVDVPYGEYDIYTTVQPTAFPNERIILRVDVLKVV